MTRACARAHSADSHTTRYGWGMSGEELSHVDATGRARMVDVGSKPDTERRARARATVRMSPDTADLVRRGDAPKGDVVGTARLACIQAAKRTPELIPLAHPLPLTLVDVEIEIDAAAGEVSITADARTTAKTGVEMEAMTACAVAALTIYDMVKGVERGVTIASVELLEKTGGKKDWARST
jgi:cyclic pyranopterin phosphate synthase